MRTAERIARIRAARPRVAVVGDFLLDGWWSGRIERIAREAPAPIVDLSENREAPGGAANTALNLAALGAEVHAVGVVGDDDAAHRLRKRLEDAGVDATRVRGVPGARTTTKVRVSVDDQVLVRLDRTQREGWPASARAALLADVRAAAAGSDALLICDYGSAVLDEEVIEALGEIPRPPLLVVDAHDPARWRAVHPDVVTPNAGEAERVCERPLGDGEERVERVPSLAGELFAGTGAGAVVVTLDRTGTVLLQPGSEPHRTRAHPVPERQASGAGDVFAAALVTARASGLPLGEAVELAQTAADVSVSTPGTCVCSLADLESWSEQSESRVLALDRLLERLDRHRRSGDRVVFTNGCFDVLHRGHTAFLNQAKRLGEVLVVGVNSDASARRLKGPGRPVTPAGDRASVVAELACVDYVVVFDDDTACELIRRIVPEVYAKGGDYTPEMLAESEEVRRVGGGVAILDYVPQHSTSELIDRMRTESEPSVPSCTSLHSEAGSR